MINTYAINLEQRNNYSLIFSSGRKTTNCWQTCRYQLCYKADIEQWYALFLYGVYITGRSVTRPGLSHNLIADVLAMQCREIARRTLVLSITLLAGCARSRSSQTIIHLVYWFMEKYYINILFANAIRILLLFVENVQ